MSSIILTNGYLTISTPIQVDLPSEVSFPVFSSSFTNSATRNLNMSITITSIMAQACIITTAAMLIITTATWILIKVTRTLAAIAAWAITITTIKTKNHPAADTTKTPILTTMIDAQAVTTAQEATKGTVIVARVIRQIQKTVQINLIAEEWLILLMTDLIKLIVKSTN